MDLFPKKIYVYWDDPTADDKCMIAAASVEELDPDTSFVGVYTLSDTQAVINTRELKSNDYV